MKHYLTLLSLLMASTAMITTGTSKTFASDIKEDEDIDWKLKEIATDDEDDVEENVIPDESPYDYITYPFNGDDYYIIAVDENKIKKQRESGGMSSMEGFYKEVLKEKTKTMGALLKGAYKDEDGNILSSEKVFANKFLDFVDAFPKDPNLNNIINVLPNDILNDELVKKEINNLKEEKSKKFNIVNKNKKEENEIKDFSKEINNLKEEKENKNLNINAEKALHYINYEGYNVLLKNNWENINDKEVVNFLKKYKPMTQYTDPQYKDNALFKTGGKYQGYYNKPENFEREMLNLFKKSLKDGEDKDILLKLIPDDMKKDIEEKIEKEKNDKKIQNERELRLKTVNDVAKKLEKDNDLYVIITDELGAPYRILVNKSKLGTQEDKFEENKSIFKFSKSWGEGHSLADYVWQTFNFLDAEKEGKQNQMTQSLFGNLINHSIPETILNAYYGMAGINAGNENVIEKIIDENVIEKKEEIKIDNVIENKDEIKEEKNEKKSTPIDNILNEKISNRDKALKVIDYAVSQLDSDFWPYAFGEKMRELGVNIIGWNELLDGALDKELDDFEYKPLRAKLAVNNLKNKIIQNKGYNKILTFPGYN